MPQNHLKEREMRRFVFGLMMVLLATSPAWSGGAGEDPAASTSDEVVTIEFIQWWEPELPDGAFRQIIDNFEEENPGIRVELISGPYSNTRDQIVTGAATGTLSDVVGLDGAWVNDLAQQGAITPLDPLMQSSDFDPDQVADIIEVNGSSYMFPVATFVYPVFVNLDMFEEAGIDELPTTRAEFFSAARALTDLGPNEYGWVLPLSLQAPNGVQNDVMSWVWASGGSMMEQGRPNLTNPEVVSALEFIQSMYDAGVISPGSFAKQEQDKVEEFVNGRVGMMISTLAHINMIRERNPELNFTISDFPAVEGYTGPRGMPYAAWGIGVSEGSEHKEEAWKLVSYLMSPEVNSQLVTIANAFPGNVNAAPDLSGSDELFERGFELFQEGYLANEFVGLPVAEELMRLFGQEIQTMLEGEQSANEAAAAAQEAWLGEF